MNLSQVVVYAMNRPITLLVICSLAVVFCSIAVAQHVDSLTGRVRMVHIAGKQYTLEESVPIISAMLKSQDKKQREEAMEAARVWGSKLKGSSLVPEIIGQFAVETTYELKLLSLATLCTIADERAVSVYKLATDSTNIHYRVAGVVGLAEFQPREAFPGLLDCMLVSTNALVVNEALMAMQEIAGYDMPLPATMETWTSKSAKERYRKECLQWWEANKDQLIAKWKAKHSSGQKTALPRNTAAPATVSGLEAVPGAHRSPTQK